MKNTTLINIPEFAKRLKTSNLILENETPIFIRTNGMNAEFYCGSTAIGGEIEIQVLDYRWIKEARWNTPEQYWLDVCFADRQGKVCMLSVKKSSAVNLAAAFTDLSNQADTVVVLHALWLRLGFIEQPINNDQSYYQSYYLVDVIGHKWATELEYGKAHIFLDELGHDGDETTSLWVIPGEVS